ncbi:MAG: glutathione S-transferase family protein [Pseudomonadota bacterium]|jgi:glutathione S-transferase
MKLYCHPISTTSRPVLLFIAETGAPVEVQLVDLLQGEHQGPEFAALNPNRLVPVLEDGDFRLTECSAILKYLADKLNSPLYPKDLKARARVNERMDWFNTQLRRELNFGLVYPQVFPYHRRRSDEAQAAQLELGRENSRRWLKVLNDHIIGPNAFVCGDDLTIADMLGVSIVMPARVTGTDFAAYPNIRNWLGRMKMLPGFAPTYQAFEGLVQSCAGREMVSI